MMRVLNKYRDQIPDDAINIMRPGILGNPFLITRQRSRGRIVSKHRKYALERYRRDKEFAKAVHDCTGHDLVCCCSPLPCHGDNIVWICSLIAKGRLPPP